jgi:hypothetical protein
MARPVSASRFLAFRLIRLALGNGDVNHSRFEPTSGLKIPSVLILSDAEDGTPVPYRTIFSG